MKTRRLQLHKVIADNNTRRLHHFAGRYLSEQEFDLMQQYVDERCEDLLCAASPGIVYGLDVIVSGVDDNIDISVRPGLGVDGQGRVVHVNFPIHLDWGSLIDEYKKRINSESQNAQTTGFFFLTVKRQVALLDQEKISDPCSRTEPDPLRDSRLETFATLDLYFISNASSLMAITEKDRASMRVLVHCLNHSPFHMEASGVPVCLLKIVDDELEWVDERVGRFAAEEGNIYQNILNFWQALQRTIHHPHNEGETLQSLASLTGVDYLPAAGPFPSDLLTDIAGRESEIDPSLWRRPVLHFNPKDLQMELVPVPANSVDGVIQYELQRGVVDLVHNQHDRIRIMVAVEPDDYRDDLLNLPDIDRDLLEELHRRYLQTASDYMAWEKEYFGLYGKLISGEFNYSNLSKIDLLRQIYLVAAPENDYFELDAKERELAWIPVNQPRPQSTIAYFEDLIAQRSSKSEVLPRPYSLIKAEISEWQKKFPEIVQQELNIPDGLYRQREMLRYEIEIIESFINESSSLIDEISDFLILQRQQLDSITVSFAGLASGIIGDGSGLSLMRWIDSIESIESASKSK